MSDGSHQDYRPARTVVVSIAVSLFSFVARAQQQPPGNPTTQASVQRRQLVKACEQIRRVAVKGPYGWGWPGNFETNDVEESTAAPGKRTKRMREAPPPDINVRVTAAVGVMMQIAGRELNNTPAKEDALQAARGIAAVQLPTGQIPAAARLMPRPAGHAETVGIVPDRSSTCAGLGLMLLVIESNGDKADAQVKAAATRAATWLARQQTGSGGWQTAYPPGAGPKAQRLIRLDSTSYRDSTLTLLAAANVLGRTEYSMAADRSLDQLLRLRIRIESSPGKNLWSTAYTLNGDMADDILEFPRGVDLLATQHCLQTLLAAEVINRKRDLSKEIATATDALKNLRRNDADWHRRYDLFLKTSPDAESNADEKTKSAGDGFDHVAFARLLQALLSSQVDGQDVFAKHLLEKLGPVERVAAIACRLTDDPVVDAPNRTPSPLPEPLTTAWKLTFQLAGRNSEK
jgi:hypothetical protein